MQLNTPRHLGDKCMHAHGACTCAFQEIPANQGQILYTLTSELDIINISAGHG